MAPRTWTRVAAGLLSMLVPGAGQLLAGARRRAAVLLAASAAVAAAMLALALARPFDLAAAVDRRVIAAFLLADLLLLGLRLFAVVDAWRCGSAAASRLALLALGGLVVATAAPHVAAGYVTVRGYDVLESVFAAGEPADVLPARGIFLVDAAPPPEPRLPNQLWPRGSEVAVGREPVVRVDAAHAAPLEASADVVAGAEAQHPWLTVLLLGSDEGPGQPGDRTDTMILVALQRSTGRAAAFGIPRNLVDVPVGGRLVRFSEPLNGLYQFGAANPELFPGGTDPGATALKHAISRLLGIRVDYYALVDLKGFADLVDALGGVDIRVKERIHDEVTRPAWGEPKPSIDVFPGRTYHFFGREALAYVRSRKASDDYSRMARQRCFLSAMAHEVDVVSVLRNFGSLASTVKASIRTDIPLARLPELVRLAAATDTRRTVTATFGPEYIARRRADDFPVPAVARIHTAVREAILVPRAVDEGRLESVRKAC